MLYRTDLPTVCTFAGVFPPPMDRHRPAPRLPSSHRQEPAILVTIDVAATSRRMASMRPRPLWLVTSARGDAFSRKASLRASATLSRFLQRTTSAGETLTLGAITSEFYSRSPSCRSGAEDKTLDDEDLERRTAQCRVTSRIYSLMSQDLACAQSHYPLTGPTSTRQSCPPPCSPPSHDAPRQSHRA